MATPADNAVNDAFHTLRFLCAPQRSDKCSIKAMRRHLIMDLGFFFF